MLWFSDVVHILQSWKELWCSVYSMHWFNFMRPISYRAINCSFRAFRRLSSLIMEIGITGILAAIAIASIFLYYRLMARYNFWKELHVVGPKPAPIIGNSKDLILGRKSNSMFIKGYYDQYKSEPYFGIYERNSPMLIIKDLELVKDVLVKDFVSFPGRGLRAEPDLDPFAQSLANLEYEKWRFLRPSMTPVFSSGKLKNMFSLVDECAQSFEKYVGEIVKKNELIECRDLASKFTMDTTGVCIFGLNINSLGDENSGFRKFAKQFLGRNFLNVAREFVRYWLPWFYSPLSPLIYNRAADFFKHAMKDTMDQRKKEHIRRNDIVDSLLDLRDLPKEELNNMEMTDSFLTAQAYTFFLAGFETTSLAITHTFYELALHPQYQDRLREEIREVIAKDGQLKYDNIWSLKYLDKVIKEVLRKYPSIPLLRRISVTPYTFQSTKLTIPANTLVIIPMWAIHRDPEIWPDPDTFDPERFDDINEKKRHAMSYLPFGYGPRGCIGLRFSYMMMKIGIATFINKFKLETCDKTTIPYRVNLRALISQPAGGIYLKLTKC